jgi:hypothetical protein
MIPAMATLEQAYAAAIEMLAAFLDPAQTARRSAMTLALRPRDEDYPLVFVSGAAEQARQGYGGLWTSSPVIEPGPDQTSMRVNVAMAEELTGGTTRSREFPGGYAEVARAFVPGRVWIAWKFVVPGETLGLAFDGLVYLDGRFAWFPKPWRVIRAPAGPTPMSHWGD